MLRGPLHDRGADGRCVECDEPFPCPTRIAIFEAVKRELERPTPPPEPFSKSASASPVVKWEDLVRWEDLKDREFRCPKCLHWWASHGVPDEDRYGCGIPMSSIAERKCGIFQTCDCTFAEGNRLKPNWIRLTPLMSRLLAIALILISSAGMLTQNVLVAYAPSPSAVSPILAPVPAAPTTAPACIPPGWVVAAKKRPSDITQYSPPDNPGVLLGCNPGPDEIVRGDAVIAVDAALVHSKPFIASSPVASLPYGTQVQIIGQIADWFQVKMPDQSVGWVAAAWIVVGER